MQLRNIGPGRNAPARFLLAVLALIGFASVPATAQQAPRPPQSNVPVPGELELAKMIWSTMAAVDHGNQAGNYSVLRDLSAPGFQINNDASRLSEIFASLRASRIDLSNTLLLAPTYLSAPQMVQPDVLRVQGYFGLRPTAINFEFFYQWVQGRWRLFGVSIAPASIATQQPGPPPVAQPQGQQPRPQQPPPRRN
jgi:hypothetical protein